MRHSRDQRLDRQHDRDRVDQNRVDRRRQDDTQGGRQGFTLVELLVVTGILLLLATITIATINVSFDAERIRTASRQVHSYIEGARDRAIYARELRGVRFIFDTANQQPGSRTVRSLVFVGAPERASGKLFYNTTTGAIVQHPADFPRWEDYFLRGLLKSGVRIQIPKGTGLWYTVQSVGSEDRNLDGTLTAAEDTDGVPTTATSLYLVQGSKFSPGVGASGNIELTYEMELRPAVLANQDPVELPEGIAIDLDHSRLPSEWRTGGTYSTEMDLMFSPRGTVSGAAASNGLIHFLLADSEDTIRGLAPPGDESAIDPDNRALGEWRIVSLNARTGHVSTHEIARDDAVNNSSGAAGADGFADDPYRYAETGEVAR